MAQHILKGEGAPDFAPSFLGQHYVDTVGGTHYLANGTSAAADWQAVGSGGGGGATGIDLGSTYPFVVDPSIAQFYRIRPTGSGTTPVEILSPDTAFAQVKLAIWKSSNSPDNFEIFSNSGDIYWETGKPAYHFVYSFDGTFQIALSMSELWTFNGGAIWYGRADDDGNNSGYFEPSQGYGS